MILKRCVELQGARLSNRRILDMRKRLRWKAPTCLAGQPSLLASLLGQQLLKLCDHGTQSLLFVAELQKPCAAESERVQSV